MATTIGRESRTQIMSHQVSRTNRNQWDDILF